MPSSNDAQPFFVHLWRRIISDPATPRAAVALACYLLILAVTINHLAHPSPASLQIGEVARKDFIAPVTTSYIDSEATNEARMQAETAIEPVYTYDTYVNSNMLLDLESFFNSIRSGADELEANRLAWLDYESLIEQETEPGETTDDNESVTDLFLPSDEPEDPLELENSLIEALLLQLDNYAEIRYDLRYQVSDSDIQSLLEMEMDERDLIRALVETSISEHNQDLIFHNDASIAETLNDIRESILASVDDGNLSPEEAQLASSIASYFVRPNVIEDQDATEQERLAAREATPVITDDVRAGEIFLRAGEVVEQYHIDIMTALGISTQETDSASWVGILLFSLILAISFMLGFFYLGQRGAPQLQDSRYYLLFFTIVTITYLSSFFLIQRLAFITSGTRNDILLALATLPVVAGAVLLSHYFTRMLSVTITGFIAVAITLAAGNPILLMPSLFPSLAAGLLLRRDSPKPLLIKAIIILPLIWTVTLLAEAFTSGLDMTIFEESWWILLISIAPTPVAMILATYVLDAAFNIPTSSRLQEFDNQDHPLLKKLQLEAPGTWHHSMMVGLIAEAACQALGGNTHLVRVACMYHDIGKTRRPEFFIENQRGGMNVHDKYSPWLSKIIVESHVKDGITLAKAHGLPRELIDTIPQHHGTSLITYFFRKALAMSDDGYVNEYDYRYPGPKPQTLEAACINIADAAESATRALEDPTPHRIESLVNKIYEDRLLDGQFEECGLALNQLELIKDIIIDRLVGAYHARIDYPEEEELKRQLQLKRAESDTASKSDPVNSSEEE